MLEVLAIEFDQCGKFQKYLLSTNKRLLIHNVADNSVTNSVSFTHKTNHQCRYTTQDNHTGLHHYRVKTTVQFMF